MSLILPHPPSRYDHPYEVRRNNLLEQEFEKTLRRDTQMEVGRGQIILTAPNGTRWGLAVSNAGVLSTVAL